MAKAKNTRERNWTDEEMRVFAEVLADPDNAFAMGLEMLALKRSSNKETFELIKKCLDVKIKELCEESGVGGTTPFNGV